MAINYTPQYSLLATVTVANIVSISDGAIISVSGISIGSISVSGLTSAMVSISPGQIISVNNCILTSATNPIPVNVVAGGAGDGSILDGVDTAIKATVVSYTNTCPIAVRLTDTNGDYIAPGAASSVTVSNLASVPLTISGTTIAITSLPNIGAGSVVSLTPGTLVSISTGCLVSVTSAGIFRITSLPAIGFGGSVSVSGLTSAMVSLSPGASVTISNISTAPLFTTLSPGTLVSISTGALISVTSAGIFRITSLPALGFGGQVSISNGAFITVSNGVIVSLSPGGVVLLSSSPFRCSLTTAAPISGYWSVTRTYTSATTNAILLPLSASATAHHITDLMFSNGDTHGSFTLLESASGTATFRVVLDRVILRDYGGAVINFARPLVLNTNAALIFTSRSSTNHGIMVIGYTL